MNRLQGLSCPWPASAAHLRRAANLMVGPLPVNKCSQAVPGAPKLTCLRGPFHRLACRTFDGGTDQPPAHHAIPVPASPGLFSSFASQAIPIYAFSEFFAARAGENWVYTRAGLLYAPVRRFWCDRFALPPVGHPTTIPPTRCFPFTASLRRPRGRGILAYAGVFMRGRFGRERGSTSLTAARRHGSSLRPYLPRSEDMTQRMSRFVRQTTRELPGSWPGDISFLHQSRRFLFDGRTVLIYDRTRRVGSNRIVRRAKLPPAYGHCLAVRGPFHALDGCAVGGAGFVGTTC